MDEDKTDCIMKLLCESIQRGDKCNLDGTDINALLFYAAKNGYPGVVKPLHKAGVKFDQTDGDRKTVVFHGNKDFLVALFTVADVSVNTIDRYDRTPLYYALIQDDDEAKARCLIENGANLQLTNKYGASIFTFYVEKCISKSIKVTELFDSQLFKKEPEQKALFCALLNFLYCQSPLLSVSDPRHLQFLENKSYTIIKKQKFLDALVFVQDKLKYNPEEKIRDTKIDVLSVLSLLIKLGAKAEAVDSKGNTPLHYAALLPLFDERQNYVIKIFNNLRDSGTSRSALNRNDQPALLFCLKTALKVITEKDTWKWSTQGLIEVCRFLLEHTNDLQHSRNILHIAISLINPALKLQKASRHAVLLMVVDVFKLLDEKNALRDVVNYTDSQLNSLLHLWATIELKSPEDYKSPLTEIFTFESMLKKILEYLHTNGASPNFRNISDNTPMHMCRTWTAMNLLLGKGAKRNDQNSSGHSPLLAVAIAKKNGFPGYLFPDAPADLESFWKSAIQKRLDPWVGGKQGETLFSVLLELNDRANCTALVNVACDKTSTTTYDTKLAILDAICKDESTLTLWKTNLVQGILKRERSEAGTERLDVDSASRLCCQNIVTQQMANDKPSDGEPPAKKAKNDEKENSVHYKILKELLEYGTNVYDRGRSDLSCLEIAKNCELLENLLMKQVENGMSCVFWAPESAIHNAVLEKVSRRQEYILLPKNIWYHKDKIASGTFGNFYAGINRETSDEICVKSIQKSLLTQREDIREQESLDRLAGCEQVVQRVHFIQTPERCYLISELMEGNLEDLINTLHSIDTATRISLAKLVVMAVKCLHERKIMHCNLKPENILYKKIPKLHLKIANFTQSCIFDKVPDRTARPDIISCGELLYYILSGHRHPPYSADSTGNRESWDDFACPEGTHLINKMLESKENSWPSAAEALKHPLFWPNERKVDFIKAIAKQEEFARYKVVKRKQINKDLDNAFPEFKSTGWDQVKEMPHIYHIMTKDFRKYDTSSAVELVRFIRNTYEHYSEKEFHTEKPIKVMLFKDYEFFKYFPKLLIEVYKAVTTHGWDRTVEEIKCFLNKTK